MLSCSDPHDILLILQLAWLMRDSSTASPVDESVLALDYRHSLDKCHATHAGRTPHKRCIHKCISLHPLSQPTNRSRSIHNSVEVPASCPPEVESACSVIPIYLSTAAKHTLMFLVRRRRVDNGGISVSELAWPRSRAPFGSGPSAADSTVLGSTQLWDYAGGVVLLIATLLSRGTSFSSDCVSSLHRLIKRRERNDLDEVMRL